MLPVEVVYLLDKEREECAKLCEMLFVPGVPPNDQPEEVAARICAAAIRGRKAVCNCGHSYDQHSKGAAAELFCRHCECGVWNPAPLNNVITDRETAP